MISLLFLLTGCTGSAIYMTGGSQSNNFITNNNTHAIIKETKTLCIGNCEYEREGTYHITNTTNTIISSKGKSMCIGNCSGTLYDNPYENSTHTIISTGGKNYCIGNC